MGKYKINIQRSAEKEPYISRILSGDANPTLKTIGELEVALRVDVIAFSLERNAPGKGNVTTMVTKEKKRCDEVCRDEEKANKGNELALYSI
ncbi:MAG: hypothetical protein HGB15_01260 [Chlorobaculum sp.]|nr:hypothetical protein [Chlorobaculum sp.]